MKERPTIEVRDASRMPVQRGDTLEVVIEKLGEEGDGIAKVEGFVVIVPGTRVGEKVQCQVTKTINTCAFAKVL